MLNKVFRALSLWIKISSVTIHLTFMSFSFGAQTWRSLNGNYITLMTAEVLFKHVILKYSSCPVGSKRYLRRQSNKEFSETLLQSRLKSSTSGEMKVLAPTPDRLMLRFSSR